MKHKRPLTEIGLALACVIALGVAADEPAPPKQGVNVQVQIQGGGQIQIQGGGQVQFNVGGIRVQGAATATAAPQTAEPPVIFIPGLPFLPFPNPAAAGAAKPGYLGVVLEDDPAAGDAENKKFNGVVVGSVVADSPAEKAGLKEGDRVFKLDGKVAENSTQLREMIRAHRPGQEAKISLKRDGKDVEVKVALGAAQPPPQAFQMFGGNVPAAVPGVVAFNSGVFRNVTGGVPPSAQAGKDAVSLRDGNRFSGRIKGIDSAKGVTFQREGFPDIDLIAEEINALTFAEAGKTADAPAKAHLQLRDGSWVSGDSLTMENGILSLTLPGGQRMEIPREHAQSVSLSNDRAPQIYEGPTAMAGWLQGRNNDGQWEYKDGFLNCVVNGAIGRNFDRLPDPLDLSFDVVYPLGLQHFAVWLFGSGLNQNGVGAMSTQFSPNQIYGTHYDGRRSNQYSVTMEDREGFADGKPKAVRYRMLVDRVNGRALIYVDGTKRADWKLSKVKPEDIGKCGGYFSFTPNVFSSDHQLRLGRIRVLPWDGKEPVNGAEPAPAKTDQILVGDGSVVDGTIEKITDAEIVVADPQGITRRDKTLYVRFGAQSAPKELPGPVAMLRMRNGSQFAATQISGSGDTLALTTRFGSQITLPLPLLREINFLKRPGQPEPAVGSVDVLTFTDGTQIKGRVFAPVEGGKLLWKIDASKTPLEFPSERVAGIFFARAKGAKESPTLKGSSAVRLGNGDWFPGDVVALDGGQLVMTTDLAPQMIVPLAELRSLYLNADVAASVADGATGRGLWTDGWNPNNNPGWTTNRNIAFRQQVATASKSDPSWLYHDGGYASTGANRGALSMLTRKWPAYSGAYAVNLEITNPGRSSSFQVQLFNSKEERTFTMYCLGGRMVVYFNPSTARLNQFIGGGKKFEADAGVASGEGNVRATMVLDRPSKMLRVLMNGKEIGRIPFKEADAAEALDVGGIAFSPLGVGTSNGKLNRIVSLWLAPWEGTRTAAPTAPQQKEAAVADPEARKDSPPAPTIYLANGDEFGGEIEKISTGVMNVTSDAGPLELPAGRVAWISFPGRVTDDLKHYPRLRFHDSGTLSVTDLHFENERVRCKAVTGQVLDFPLSLVKELIYRPLEEK